MERYWWLPQFVIAIVGLLTLILLMVTQAFSFSLHELFFSVPLASVLILLGYWTRTSEVVRRHRSNPDIVLKPLLAFILGVAVIVSSLASAYLYIIQSYLILLLGFEFVIMHVLISSFYFSLRGKTEVISAKNKSQPYLFG